MKEIRIEQLIAVHKGVAEAIAARKTAELSPGKHSLRGPVTINIDGVLTVGEDYSQRIVAKAQPWGLVALLLNEVNALREAAGMVGINIEKVTAMADLIDKDLWGRTQSLCDATMAAFKAPTWTTCKGKTTWKGLIS